MEGVVLLRVVFLHIQISEEERKGVWVGKRRKGEVLCICG